MTCIVGVVEAGQVYIGGDSAGADNRYALTLHADRKVFRNGEFLIGFTDSFRMGQLLAYSFTPPPHPDDMPIYPYMVGKFIGAVRECLKSGGYAVKDKDQESGGTFLVGYRSRLFRVAGDYQVCERSEQYDAVGCGDQPALGALHVTGRDRSMSGHDRVLTALWAASDLSIGVRAPFHILHLAAVDHQSGSRADLVP